MPTKAREKFKVEHTVFDNFTNRTLFRLISQDHLKGIESPVSVGKEANVFSALTKEGQRVIIKIYRLETCDFNKMYDYIKEDERYERMPKNKRKVIFSWVQREYKNLIRAYDSKVTTPKVIAFLNNVIVLEYIGNDSEIAPKLKDKVPEDKKDFFDKIIKNIKKLYKAGIVHADLSPFNILNNDEEPVLIDFSQSTTLKHPQAEEFLQRDIKNIVDFFNKHGLKEDNDKIFKKLIK